MSSFRAGDVITTTPNGAEYIAVGDMLLAGRDIVVVQQVVPERHLIVYRNARFFERVRFRLSLAWHRVVGWLRGDL